MNKQPLKIFKDKKIIFIIVLAFIGLSLVMLGSYKKAEKASASELDLYLSGMEKRLSDTVSRIKGAGKADIFITLKSGFENVYASNASIETAAGGKDTKKELAYMTSKSEGEVPVIVKKLCPQISGVLIVCEGGSNKAVADEIKKAVSIAAGISDEKIHVSGSN